jgi:hypothetical protein
MYFRLVADDVQAQRSAAASSHLKHSSERRFFVDSSSEPRAFFILSSVGTVHPVHFDASGFFTLLEALDGQKLFLIACPNSDTAPTPPNMEDSDPFVLMRGPGVKVYLVVLKTTDIL